MAFDTSIFQGDDVTLEVTVYQDAAETTVQDLTGYTVLAYRVGQNNCGATLLQVTGTATANGSQVTFNGDRTTGIVNVTLAAGDTSGLSVRGHKHQLVLTNASGDDKVVASGTLRVLARLPAVS